MNWIILKTDDWYLTFINNWPMLTSGWINNWPPVTSRVNYWEPKLIGGGHSLDINFSRVYGKYLEPDIKDFLNHSENHNAFYDYVKSTDLFELTARRKIKPNQEIFINYGQWKTDHILLSVSFNMILMIFSY